MYLIDEDREGSSTLFDAMKKSLLFDGVASHNYKGTTFFWAMSPKYRLETYFLGDQRQLAVLKNHTQLSSPRLETFAKIASVRLKVLYLCKQASTKQECSKESRLLPGLPPTSQASLSIS